MTLLARAFSTLLGYLLLVAFAIAGVGIAIFCIQGGTESLSPSHLAELIHLAELRDTVGSWFGRLEGGGGNATIAAICGAGAIVLGLFLALGALVPRRDRLLVLEEGPTGSITARRRAAAGALAYLAERPRDVLQAKVTVKPNRRRAGGRASLKLLRTRSGDESERAETSRRELEKLEAELSLRPRVRNRLPRRGGRVV